MITTNNRHLQNWKRTIYGMITITDGDDDDADVLGTYYVSDKYLADAIEISEGLDVFDGFISSSEKNIKMPTGNDSIPHLFIDEKLVPTYVSKTRSVACCAYNATNEFMKHWLGRQLDRHDQDWYKMNSLVTSHGLPQASSFTVIQQLTEPYGVGIDRIIVPRNSRRFKEHAPFMLSLGANPFFMADGRTSNEEAYVQLFPEVVLDSMNLTDAERKQHKKDQLSKWRFECDDQPLRGAIIMRQFQHSSTGHNGGSNYIGVRDKTDVENWWMAIKLNDLSKIEYQKPIDIPKYEEWVGEPTYRWSGIKDGNGETLGMIENRLRKVNICNGKKNTSTALVPMTAPKGVTSEFPDPEDTDETFFGNSATGTDSGDYDEKIWAYPPVCSECGKVPGDNVYVDNKRACRHCGTEVKSRLISVYELLDGWEPADMDSIGEDFPDEPSINFDDNNLPHYDPYFWGRDL